MGHSFKIHSVRIPGHVLAHGYLQLGLGGCEALGRQDLLHPDDAGVLVGDLDPDGSLARNGCYDPDAQGGEAQSNVILQAFDLGDPDPRGRYDLVKGDRGAYGGLDFFNFDVVIN